ncbi:hypothetical protein SDC9_109849 [bioreactor metagenome]|uniref:Uncharacterized protein n=1 Tax=bioreactor metagenome TaxID=1076179 RepID=A0A645BE89_9ZZZZ
MEVCKDDKSEVYSRQIGTYVIFCDTEMCKTHIIYTKQCKVSIGAHKYMIVPIILKVNSNVPISA